MESLHLENGVCKLEKVIWLTGLSAAGKSTIALAIKDKLDKCCCVIDGDTIRKGLTRDLGFSENDRKENVRIAAEVAKLSSINDIVAIVALISPYEKHRRMAKDIIGKNFIEVYVKCSLDTCIKRDPKGLYKKAIEGKIQKFTGITDLYEEPKNPDVIIDTCVYSIDECVMIVLEKI